MAGILLTRPGAPGLLGRMQIRRLLSATLILAFGVVAARAVAPATRVVLPTNVDPVHYDVSVEPDIPNLTFKGSVAIRLAVREATDRIVLNIADLGLDRAALAGAPAPVITSDPKVETASFAFPQPLAPGEHVLTIDYHGKIYQQASGLFALDYETPSGTKRALFTQFENSDARRFMPCWDEPGRKATFTLTATMPAAELPLSNMPVAASEPLPDGRKRVRFAESPKMSTYLLYFGCGDFERVSRVVAGVDIGVVMRRGETAKGAFALETAARILPYYNEYFGVPYPLPKLDLIAAPGQSQFFGAMENWGAIFYFERIVLFDPKVTTDRDKQFIYSVIAHEMAHQWFGNLVTMAWWDDLWLNEGFASWMARKVTDHFHPERNAWLQSLDDKQNSMQMDGKGGTHPIITPIDDVFQASGAFDDITYKKGEAVIRMFEAYVGEDAFRTGVRRYMKNHAYGNTVTDDLWREIDAVSPRKLTPIAHDFTRQAGVPLITATPTPEGGLSLTQGRFALDESGAAGGSWQVPVMVLPVTGKELASVQRLVVPAGAATVVPDAPAGSVVNAGQTAYFRTLYRGAAFTALSERYATLSPDDQLGLMNDVATLGNVGAEPMADLLILTVRLPVTADPVVLNRMVDCFGGLDHVYRGREGRAAFQAFARSRCEPVLARVGWDPVAGESENVGILRGTVLATLGRMGSPGVIAEARRRFATFVKDRASLTGSIRSAVLSIVAYNADAATWEQIHQLARGATDWVEKQDYYLLLGRTVDPVLAQRALALALTEEPEPTLRPALLSAVSGEHPDLAIDAVTAHWDIFKRLLEPTSHARFAPGLVSSGSDLALVTKLEAFAEAHIPASARQDVNKATATIRYAASIREKRLPEVDRWLAEHAPGTAK